MVRTASANLRHVFSPLSVHSFRAIWIAAFCMNTGLFIQDLGCAWLMTSLSKSPVMVASLQTAAMLPFVILTLPAGAGADLVDRRRLLLLGQGWLIVTVLVMSMLTLAGLMSAPLLLLLVCMLAVGNAINSPAWNVVMPSLVPCKILEPTISLNNAGYNLARGFGSILGGVIVASFGSGWAFAACSVGLAYMFFSLCHWQYDERPAGKSVPFVSALMSGLQYVRKSDVMISVIVRTALYMLPVSVMWSLVPLLAREHLHVTSTQYGLMVAAFGLGTLSGAFLQPRVRQKLSLDGLSALGTLFFIVAFLLLSVASHFGVGLLCMLLCGMGWTAKNASLNLTVQVSAPSWIRARAYSVYLFAFQGCTAVGSMCWGALANAQGMSFAFATAAILLGLELLSRHKFRLAPSAEFCQALSRDDIKILQEEHTPTVVSGRA